MRSRPMSLVDELETEINRLFPKTLFYPREPMMSEKSLLDTLPKIEINEQLQKEKIQEKSLLPSKELRALVHNMRRLSTEMLIRAMK